MFSEKATKINKIFTINLALCSKCQMDGEDFINFNGLLRKYELYNNAFTIYFLVTGHLHLKTKNTNDILKVEISLVKIWKYVIEISEETTEVEESWLVIIFISGPSHCCTARQVINYRNTTFLDFIAQYLPLKKTYKLLRSFKWLLGKVHIFWEDHKLLQNLHLTFDYSTYSQK